jgi:GTP cyclohydrolase II/3,4-dihydroxy 2-butanone 4-phosphate synthase/GTP cyclohydrolase II
MRNASTSFCLGKFEQPAADGVRAPHYTPPVQLPALVDGQEIAFQAQGFRSRVSGTEALCLVHRNEPKSDEPPIVRVHSGCVTGDIFHSLRCDCHEQLQCALRAIVAAPYGVLIYLPAHEGRGIGLFEKMRAYGLQENGLDTVDANLALGAPVDARDYTLAAEILGYLGITRLRLLSNNPAKANALAKQQLTIVERLPLVVASNPHNQQYLQTKRSRLAHAI